MNSQRNSQANPVEIARIELNLNEFLPTYESVITTSIENAKLNNLPYENLKSHMTQLYAFNGSSTPKKSLSLSKSRATEANKSVLVKKQKSVGTGCAL